jgi:hypothetical protein
MSTFTKKSLATGSAFAIAAAALVAPAPAYAAGEVSIVPASGSTYTVFNTDEFKFDTNVITAAVASNTISWALTDADQGKWYIKIGELDENSGATATTTVTMRGTDAFGNAVADLDPNTGGNQDEITLAIINDNDANDGFGDNEAENFGEFLVDFDLSKATTIYLSAYGLHGATQEISISPFEGTVNATGHEELAAANGSLGPVGNTDEYDHGDGAAAITIQSWIDLDADYDDIEAAYASEAVTVNWIDPKGVSVVPRVERFITGGTEHFNDTSSANLGGSLQFVAANLNLDQVDLAKWNFTVTQADGSNPDAGATAGDFVAGDAKVRDGYADHSSAGKIYIMHATAGALVKANSYKWVIDHDSATTTDFGSVAFSLPSGGEEYHIEATVDTSDDLAAQTSHTDTASELLVGTTSRTWTAQIKTDNDTAAETASVPVMALVEYPSTYAPGTLTVSGTAETVSSKSGYVLVNGFTDADGQWEVTVSSSSAVKAENYTITFFVVDDGAGVGAAWVKTDVAAGNDAEHTITYTASDATNTALTVANSVLSGSTVTASFSVADIFGIGTNLDGTKTMQIELKATDTDNLKEYVAVAADGSAEITFTNWLGEGESDVLTATLFTGAQDDQTSVDSATLTLYNAPDVAAVQVPATITTDITYDDFLTGGAKTSAAAPAPNDGDVELKGTVVDTNGAGIPGGVVTIKGAGLQFVEDGGTKYYTDEITVVSDAAGVFDINVYSHIVNATGVDITVTAGGASATTTLKTYLPAAGVNGNNLAFSMNLPANIVMNKTYAVTVQLTDKWGNPVQTADNGAVSGLSIIGTGSVQINSSDKAITKNFNKAGQVTVFVRSVKDIAGPGAVTATLQAANYDATSAANATALVVTEIATDVETTAWDETLFTNEIDTNVEVTETEAAAAAPAPAAGTKVNAGSFKGYVALYAKGHAGKRMSAKVGKDWVVVPVLASNFERVVEFTGAGVDVAVRIYIDRVLLETINLTTK